MATAVLDRPSTSDGPAGSPSRVRERIGTSEALVYAGLLLALAVIVWTSQHGLFTPDIKPEVYLNPLERLRLDLSSWLPDPALGTANYNLGLAPLDAVSALIQQAGLSPEATVRMLRFPLYAVAGWGALRVFREVSDDSDLASGRVATAVAYVCVPYAVVGASSMAALLPYALFPWQTLVLIKALRGADSLRSLRSWRYPALFALIFFLMSGMNVGAVPLLQLVAIPAVVYFVRRSNGTSWLRLLIVVAQCGLLSFAVSLYWLIPAITAAGAGQTIADNSETLEGIVASSSWSEVIRGLGLWPMYGANASGPWQPGFVSYLQSFAVIAASFLIVVMAATGALVSRARARVLGVLLIILVGAVMVSAFPAQLPSPWGRALTWLIDNVPGLIALRTTNKAGAGLVLGVALLIGLGATAVGKRLPSHASRAGVAIGAAVVFVGAAGPAFAGQLYVSRWEIPAYWTESAKTIDAQSSASRTWFVPGQVLAGYQWSTEAVDDVNLSFLSNRPSLVRTVLPTQSAELTNYLYAADSALNDSTLPLGSLSAYARYLGVGDVLLRNDVRWSDHGGGRPAVIQPQLDNDSGLTASGTWGAPGLNTTAPTFAPTLADEFEAGTPALHRYTVTSSRGIVRTEAVAGTVVIQGDGASVGALNAAGLLSGSPSFRYAADLTPQELTDVLGPNNRIVITDTNRRRNIDPQHLADANGPLLLGNEPTTNTRALFGVADQVVAKYDVPILTVSASSYATGFGRGGSGIPDFAFDGDPRTAWQFGAFGTAVGEHIDLMLTDTRPIHEITIAADDHVSAVRVTSMRVTVGKVSHEVELDDKGAGILDFGGAPGDRVVFAVTGTTGSGIGLAQINELHVQGVTVVKSAQVPDTISRLADQLSPTARALLQDTPMDVVLTREHSDNFLRPSEEAGLNRSVTLPVSRTFRVYGVARPDPRPSGGSYKPDSKGCYPISDLDGTMLRVKPVLGAKPAGGAPWLFAGCAPVSLTAGVHSVRSAQPWTVDTLVLRDISGEVVHAPAPWGSLQVVEDSPTNITADVRGAQTAYWFVSGVPVDARWHASLDGQDLGAPAALDGGTAAWRITAVGDHRISVNYEPQRIALLTRAISLAALLGCFLLAFARRRPLAGSSPIEFTDSLPNPRWLASMSRMTRISTRSLHRCFEALGFVVAFGLLGGPAFLPVGVALAVFHLWIRPRAKLYLKAAVALFALVPFMWIIGNIDHADLISPELVSGNLWPSRLALVGVVLLTMGVICDDREVVDEHPA